MPLDRFIKSVLTELEHDIFLMWYICYRYNNIEARPCYFRANM
jgi:hypothetical protein